MKLSPLKAIVLLFVTAGILIFVNSNFFIQLVGNQAGDLIGKMSIAIFGALMPFLVASFTPSNKVTAAPEPPSVPEERPSGTDAQESLQEWIDAYSRLEQWATDEITRQKTQIEIDLQEKKSLARSASLFRHSIIFGVSFAVLNFILTVYSNTFKTPEFSVVSSGILYFLMAFIAAAYLAARMSKSSQVPLYIGLVSVFYVSVTSLLVSVPYSYREWFGETAKKLFQFEYGTALIVHTVVILPLLAAFGAWMGCCIGRAFNKNRASKSYSESGRNGD